jgi:hypothetical protein
MDSVFLHLKHGLYKMRMGLGWVLILMKLPIFQQPFYTIISISQAISIQIGLLLLQMAAGVYKTSILAIT